MPYSFSLQVAEFAKKALKQYAHLGYAPCEMRQPPAPEVKAIAPKPAKIERLTAAAA